MKGAVARMMGSTVVSQALLSASNFFVASFLLRQLGAEPYGFYVLVTTGIILFVNLQGAFFITPTMAIVPASELRERQLYIGALIKFRHRVAVTIALLVVIAAIGAWALDWLELDLFLLIVAGAFAGSAALLREFVRSILLAHHQMGEVLRGDVIYALLLVVGAVVAVHLPSPAVMAVASLGLAALVNTILSARYLWRFEPWVKESREQVVNRIASMGGWAAWGSMVHWSFSQGYTYVVAALLDVKAVAALAATRLLLMPLNLLSSGIYQSMFPLASRWHAAEGLPGTVRRVLKICVVVVTLGLAYVLVAWFARGLFFDVLLKKRFDDQDTLILLWSTLFVLMLIRDQLTCILLIRYQSKMLGYITTVSAITALLLIWFCVLRFGSVGALVGIITGELINMVSMMVLLAAELRRSKSTPQP